MTLAVPPTAPLAPVAGRLTWRSALRQLIPANRKARVGLAIIAGYVLVAAVGPWIVQSPMGLSPTALTGAVLQPPRAPTRWAPPRTARTSSPSSSWAPGRPCSWARSRPSSPPRCRWPSD